MAILGGTTVRPVQRYFRPRIVCARGVEEQRRCVLGRSHGVFSSRRRHTRLQGDWSSDVCSSDLPSGTEQLRTHEWSSSSLLNPRWARKEQAHLKAPLWPPRSLGTAILRGYTCAGSRASGGRFGP